MSTTDELLETTLSYAWAFTHGALPRPRAKRSPMPASTSRGPWGPAGDAHVVRNAGGVVRDDAIRLWLISRRLPWTRERSCSFTTPTATC